ncbi:MAG: glycerol kinase GlpK [Candidatus Bipolaricaulota bacterium]|nr:glycerol kinase GlpK [Candidatus Bipolaricaulota bacterium]MBS3792033.1 glycerol kinase GlpK [Candidatus Bipolaricaulota bacterium]
MAKFVGAIDQGTTGTRFIVFDHEGNQISSAYREHEQIYPEPGWIEHDPDEIWEKLGIVTEEALEEAGLNADDLVSVGITNQRETVFTWDERGEPLHNGIVWQDRRTSDRCEELEGTHVGEVVKGKTGLRLDPYFSATKIEWLLKNVNGLRGEAEKGEALFGTIESWLIWKLTGGDVYVTDHTNASRTMLFDIEEKVWDQELLDFFDVPRRSLPDPVENVQQYGEVSNLEPLNGVAIGAALGDQQAALFGQGCYNPGEAKNTYGTGSFLLVNVGDKPCFSENLLTTIGFSADGETRYALEGSIYSTGATIQWLRDGLNIVDEAAESEKLAKSVDGNDGVYMVPAFAGLGAPHWDSNARGTIVGLTRGSDERHLARAGLESIAYQVEDVLRSMKDEADQELDELRVDGGAAENNFLCQFQSDISSLPVVRTGVFESSALGAAYGAGLTVGFWNGLEELEELIKSKGSQRFEPDMEPRERAELYNRWIKAVKRARNWTS